MVTVAQNRGPNQPSTITKPKVSIDYNLHKCHVDRVDQLRQYYSLYRKTVRSWPSLAWWLIDMCIINAYTLWRLDTSSQMSQLEFREALLLQLQAAYPSPSSSEQQAVPSDSIRPSDGHWPQHSSRRRNCIHCSEGRNHRIRSNYICSGCGKHLCIDPCFRLYHVARGIDNPQP